MQLVQGSKLPGMPQVLPAQPGGIGGAVPGQLPPQVATPAAVPPATPTAVPAVAPAPGVMTATAMPPTAMPPTAMPPTAMPPHGAGGPGNPKEDMLNGIAGLLQGARMGSGGQINQRQQIAMQERGAIHDAAGVFQQQMADWREAGADPRTRPDKASNAALKAGFRDQIQALHGSPGAPAAPAVPSLAAVSGVAPAPTGVMPINPAGGAPPPAGANPFFPPRGAGGLRAQPY